MEGVRKRVRWNLLIALSALAVVLPLAGDSARGVPLIFNLDIEFSGGAEPVGAAPWLRATFEDEDGSVKLTMEDLTLTNSPAGGEHVKNWNFNLNPDLDPTLLDITHLVNKDVGAFGPVTPTAERDFFQANGDGLFDIMFLFADTDGADIKFGPGDSVSFLIESIEPITAESFFEFSIMDGLPALEGIFLSAAQIQGIGPGDESGWIGFVPEPSTAALLILGAIALIPLLRRRGKR